MCAAVSVSACRCFGEMNLLGDREALVIELLDKLGSHPV